MHSAKLTNVTPPGQQEFPYLIYGKSRPDFTMDELPSWFVKIADSDAYTAARFYLPFSFLLLVTVFFYFQNTEHALSISSVGLLLLGFFFWSFVEYLLHRFLFHYEPKTNRGKKIFYLIHGLHHDFPQHPRLIALPPITSWWLALLFWFMSYWVAGNFASGSVLFVGILWGYLAYEHLHFLEHHSTSQNPIIKYLKKYHMVHHFKDHSKGYGISTPLWDFIFGTEIKFSPRDGVPQKR